jgi:hypothetical protein
MVKAKRIVYDVRTGELREEEFEYTPLPTPPPPPPTTIDINDLVKLIDYAKKMGWI